MKMRSVVLAFVLPGLTVGGVARSPGVPPSEESAHPANTFYNASVETHRVTRNLKTDYGVTGEGKEDDSGKLQRAIDEISAQKGGGDLLIPAGEYRFANIEVKSNVHLRIEQGTTLRPYLKDARRSVALFEIGARGNAVENVSVSGIGGRYQVRLEEFEPGLRVFKIHQVKNFRIANVDIHATEMRYSCICFFPSEAGLATGGCPTRGTVENASVFGASYGYGLTQIHAARSVLFQNLHAQGGTTLRFETDLNKKNSLSDLRYAGVFNVAGRKISCENGNAAVIFQPHTLDSGIVTIDGVKSVSCGYAVRISAGFISKKQTEPDLKVGSFAKGTSVKNIDATFGLNAQLTGKDIKKLPKELLAKVEKSSKGLEVVRGPSVTAVYDFANYEVAISGVTAHGFEHNPPVIKESRED